MVAGYRQCIGFPVGSCSVMKSGKLDKATKEELAVIEELPVEQQKDLLDKTLGKRIARYEAGFMEGLCNSCSEKKGISKRKKKIMKLRQRQDEHELSILKILMSKLTVKKKRTSMSSKTDGKGRFIRDSLEKHEIEEDRLFLDRLFTIIRNKTKLEDLPVVNDKTRELLREVDWENDMEKVWWNVTHIYDKSKAGWREGFTESGEGEGKYIEDKENLGWFIESPKGGYIEMTRVIPKTNTRQIKKFLARLEGVR